MYLSKITTLSSGHAAQSLLRRGVNGSYASHQRLWTLFSREPARNFLFREEQGPLGLPHYWVLSENLPRDEERMYSIQSKPFQPRLQAGEHLAFSLRANPTISVKALAGKSKKHDVLMHAKKIARQAGVTDAGQIQACMDEAAHAWLADETRLAQWGIALACAPQVEAYSQHESVKSRGQKIAYSSVDYQGLLRVESPERFLQQLFCGFGRAKAFGCGLMLIRRAS